MLLLGKPYISYRWHQKASLLEHSQGGTQSCHCIQFAGGLQLSPCRNPLWKSLCYARHVLCCDEILAGIEKWGVQPHPRTPNTR